MDSTRLRLFFQILYALDIATWHFNCPPHGSHLRLRRAGKVCAADATSNHVTVNDCTKNFRSIFNSFPGSFPITHAHKAWAAAAGAVPAGTAAPASGFLNASPFEDDASSLRHGTSPPARNSAPKSVSM